MTGPEWPQGGVERTQVTAGTLEFIASRDSFLLEFHISKDNLTVSKWSQGRIDRAQVTASMLEFIASTARVSGEFSQIDTYTRTKPHFGSPSIEELKTEITAGAQVIEPGVQGDA